MSNIVTVDGSTVSPKYARFTITDVDYKRMNGTPIPASVMLPKDVQAGRHPVLIHWHGGGLVTGARLFPDWFGNWILDFAYSKQAIIISPDYRLLPEAKGIEQLQDCRDFYSWLFEPDNLTALLPENMLPRLDHILVTGESAGGWFALQSGFLLPSSKIGAIIAQYPMIDMRSAHFTSDFDKAIFQPPAPQLPRRVVDDHIANLGGDEVVTTRAPFDPLMLAIVQRGMYSRFFGTQAELYPLEVLDTVQAFPPVWIVHGTKDSVVPVSGTEKFAEKLVQRIPDAKMHLTLTDGEEHGFDSHNAEFGVPATLETPWVRDGLEFIDHFWPAQ